MVQPNPFTPKSGQAPRVFTGREFEIECFKRLLEKAKRDYFDHFLVLGDWGVGKTALLKEFRNAAQAEGILTSFVSIEKYTEDGTVLAGIKDLVTRIPKGLPTTLSKLKNYAGQIKGLGVQVLGAGVSFSRDIDYSPPVLLSDTLCSLWNDLKKETSLVVVFLDDVQNFESISEIFTTFRNVLSSDEIIKGTRYLFGLSCTTEMWSQFLQRHHPIGRYFTPRLKLARLSQEKTHAAISSILEGTGVRFEEGILSKIFEYTGGHPFELQVVCSHLYENQLGGMVTEKVWEKSLLDALIEIGEVVFHALYEQASFKERQILHCMALANKPLGRRELASMPRAKKIGLAENAVSMFLNRLIKKGLVKRADRHEFLLLDRFFREYLISVRNLDLDG